MFFTRFVKGFCIEALFVCVEPLCLDAKPVFLARELLFKIMLQKYGASHLGMVLKSLRKQRSHFEDRMIGVEYESSRSGS